MMISSNVRRSLGLLAVALPVALAACNTNTDAPAAAVLIPIESTTFAPALGVNLAASRRTADGLYIRDIRVGTGDSVAAGARLSVKYVGYLANGTFFDSNTVSSPFTFILGIGKVIAGWDEGLVGMRVGGQRQLVIPSALGYGASGSGSIPPYANLVFRVDLLGGQ